MAEVVSKVVSGGQAGADRGGLDAAMQLGLQIGGFVPRGRRAEDGMVPLRYVGMVETAESPQYTLRTRLNVEKSDATVVFYDGELGHGSRLTISIAQVACRPLLVLCLSAHDAREQLTRFIKGLGDRNITLNIAGSRESTSPGIQVAVRDLLIEVLRDALAPESLPASSAR